jgi:predicted RNA-binding protein YlxR (DUF448 family)
MTRIVRRPDGAIVVDPSGRAPGRGTYICQEPACREPSTAAAAVKRALGAEPSALEFEVNDAAK